MMHVQSTLMIWRSKRVMFHTHGGRRRPLGRSWFQTSKATLFVSTKVSVRNRDLDTSPRKEIQANSQRSSWPLGVVAPGWVFPQSDLRTEAVNSGTSCTRRLRRDCTSRLSWPNGTRKWTRYLNSHRIRKQQRGHRGGTRCWRRRQCMVCCCCGTLYYSQ